MYLQANWWMSFLSTFLSRWKSSSSNGPVLPPPPHVLPALETLPTIDLLGEPESIASPVDERSLKVVLKFKTDRQKTEFFSADQRVKSLALLLAYQMKMVWGYQAVVTSVLRSETEQGKLLAEGKTTITESPHLSGRAIDIRLNDFQALGTHLHLISDFINLNYPRADGKPSLLIHGAGSNIHAHLQVPAKKEAV